MSLLDKDALTAEIRNHSTYYKATESSWTLETENKVHPSSCKRSEAEQGGGGQRGHRSLSASQWGN